MKGSETCHGKRVLLSARSNASHGVDVLVSGTDLIQSSCYEVDKRTRYSYIDADGEIYNVSDVVAGELGDNLLHSVNKAPSNKLDHLLSRIEDGKGNGKLPSSHRSDGSLQSKCSSSPSSRESTQTS